MSLRGNQFQQTSDDLHRHLEASGLDEAELGRWLGLDTDEVRHVLSMRDVDPATAWLVRDALDQAVRERGVDAGGWRVLTTAARRKAEGWFHVREVPPRP